MGSGKLAKSGVLFDRLLEQVPSDRTMEVVVSRKVIEFDAMASQKWRELFALAAGCELSAAVKRTQAIGQLMEKLDEECHRHLRRRGLLGFDDVKSLMGSWVRSEDDRLRREAVDFRLDARYDHWLLDEFQDTSAGEWKGVEPLLDEAAAEGDGTVFVVGDRKQAIYGWRGGDVSLFDEVEDRYDGNLSIATMPESYRSCPAVLELVNRVCGDYATIEALFGEEMKGRWHWEDHISAKAAVSGYARVEEVSKEEANERLVSTLQEIRVGERQLNCGVLVRTNKEVSETAALLREEGFEVIEEGRRLPLEDNAVGAALHHLLRWLADPADTFAREVIRMSPLAGRLAEAYGEHEFSWWEGACADAQRDGFGTMVQKLIEPLWGDLSLFTRRRFGDVVSALAELDSMHGVTPREARDWISELEVPQAPGTAAVQVMTVHKSKGLGFDVVVLPSLDDEQVPARGKFRVARGGDGDQSWLLQSPASWARDLLPQLKSAEERWGQDQKYEAMCLLYVALTRAKRGLYVFLPEVSKSRKNSEEHSSLANWVRQSISEDEFGDSGWFSDVPDRLALAEPDHFSLGAATPKRRRATPSKAKSLSTSGWKRGTGVKVGREVHSLLEEIAWLDANENPKLPRTQAGAMVEDLLREAECHRLFEKPEGEISLYREQSFEVLLEGVWVSGVLDRVHVFRDGDGKVVKVEIYDFKTDRVDFPEELRESYAGQMEAYGAAAREVFGCGVIERYLVSTALRQVIGVSEK